MKQRCVSGRIVVMYRPIWCLQIVMMFFFLWAEPIWWQKIKPWNKFEFIFQNSDFILKTPRLYLTTLIRKINSSFSLLSLYPTLLPLVFLRQYSIKIMSIPILTSKRYIVSVILWISPVSLHLFPGVSATTFMRVM